MRIARNSDRGSPPGPIETDRTRSLAGLRVLVVEDAGMVAMSLKAILNEMGCLVVRTAARLQEAEELARHEELDGVLLDLKLGGQYSYPVVDILRQREIPFITMSGYDARQLRPDLAEAPQLQKPFDRDAMEAMILTEFCARRKHDKTASPVPLP